MCIILGLYYRQCCDHHETELYCSKADSRLVPSQWKTSLQSNAVSHWLGANLESSLLQYILTKTKAQFEVNNVSNVTHPLAVIQNASGCHYHCGCGLLRSGQGIYSNRWCLVRCYCPFVRGIDWLCGDSHHQGPIMQKAFPCHYTITDKNGWLDGEN